MKFITVYKLKNIETGEIVYISDRDYSCKRQSLYNQYSDTDIVDTKYKEWEDTYEFTPMTALYDEESGITCLMQEISIDVLI